MITVCLVLYLLSGYWDSNPESPVPKTGMLAVTLYPDTHLKHSANYNEPLALIYGERNRTSDPPTGRESKGYTIPRLK